MTFHNLKWVKYGDKCLAEGINFCPAIVETYGAWYKEAEAILKRLGLSLARATGGDEVEVTSHMFARLSLNMILSRSHTATAPEVDGSIWDPIN